MCVETTLKVVKLSKEFHSLTQFYQHDICHLGLLHQVKFICVAQYPTQYLNGVTEHTAY